MSAQEACAVDSRVRCHGHGFESRVATELAGCEGPSFVGTTRGVRSSTSSLPIARVALSCALFGCQRTPPAVHVPDEGRVVIERVERAAHGDSSTAVVIDAGAVRPRPARRVQFRIERVAGLDASRIFAISGESLYRVRDGQWEQLLLDGGVARDVIAIRDALWVLVEGLGDNDGRALILRSDDGDSLTPVWVLSQPLRSDGGRWSPRALALRGATWVIAGAHPSLVRVEAGRARVELDSEQARYIRAYGLQDDSVVCTREDGDFDVVRYGTRSLVVSDGILAGLYDSEGFGYVVHEDGSVWRGRPAKELRRVVNAAPFEPCVAAMLRDGRVVLAGAGGPVAIARGASWQVLPGDWPTEPVAIIPSEPPLIVARDGLVVAVEGQGRTVVRPGIARSLDERL